MPDQARTAGRTVTTETVQVCSAQGNQQQQQHVNTILARTDWPKYWSDVSVRVEREVEAYDSARARSMATASRRFIR
ncbi:MAG: hypothetical protein ABSF95_21510 [Verrucomicrobiota bacterium]|jgi:hypothetical protein